MSSKEITATLEIVTPMFLGGASPQELADAIRPPSIKGALRFWWRALNWSRVYRGDSDDDKRAALNALHTQEAALFGLAHDRDRGGQSRVLLRSKLLDPIATEQGWPANPTGSGYLGYGLFRTGTTAQRRAIREGTRFTVSMRFHPATQAEQIEQACEALRVWGLFGGLGGRGQRRGFGSVALLDIDGQSCRFDQRQQYLDAARQVIATAAGVTGEPPFTAFSHATRIESLSGATRARDAHGEMGAKFKQERAWPAMTGNRKIPFGIPLTKIKNLRRASPLMFHVHPIGERHLGVALLLPARFHPEVNIAGYQVVEEFLDHHKETR